MKQRFVRNVTPERHETAKSLRVAAYARVSTAKDAMLHSLSAQVSYYSQLIQNHKGWLYAGVYADEGISGTKQKRHEFQRMMVDARAGKIDLILTKSISRFARNTVVLLQSVRELKDMGIAVQFERENINSMTAEGELMLTLLASFAQEESRSAKLNKHWSVQKQFERGEIVGVSHLYGYDIVDGNLVINPHQAEILRMIYDDYLSGMSSSAIAGKLNRMREPRATGGQWKPHDISFLFTNEKHTGNALLQKTYKDNAVSPKLHRNRGEKTKLLAEGTHEAIIDVETFEAVQKEKAKRAPHKGIRKPTVSPFRGKIHCGQCGETFNRKKTKTEVFWRCAANLGMREGKCSMKGVPERILKALSCEVLELERFEPEIFKERIGEILIPAPNLVIFILRDGQEIQKAWQDRSRSESWTPEMREAVGQRNRERKK